MDYRDDRDALRTRIDSLESELATARAETERMRATESALAAAQRENEKLRLEIRRLTPKPAPRKGTSALTASLVAGGAVATVGVVLAFVLRADPGETPPVVTESPVPMPLATSVEGPTPKDEPRPSARATTVEWPARVVKADGLSLPPGMACTLRATLRTDGSNGSSPDVEIACGSKWLYRSTDQLEGMSSNSYAFEEVPGAEEGSHRAALSYQDQGTRTGARTQVSLTTFDRSAIVWKETAPPFRVELAVDELSVPWRGPALFTAHESRAPELRTYLSRTGKVAEVRDNALVTKGDPCSVDVRPAWDDGTNCRVRVQCGQTTLYGAERGGFSVCGAEGRTLLLARDDGPTERDGDPVLSADFPRSVIDVTDTRPSPWAVKIQLDPEQR